MECKKLEYYDANGQPVFKAKRSFDTLEEATKKYNFTMDDKDGVRITKYLDLLLTPAFKK